MTEQYVEEFIKNKLKENKNYVRFTFYELRVKNNLTEEQTDEFLKIAKIKFELMDYEVYFTDAKYEYNDARMTVQPNELMIALQRGIYA